MRYKSGRIWLYLYLLVLFVLIGGCSYRVVMESIPTNAQIFTDGNYIGDTPVTITFRDVPITLTTNPVVPERIECRKHGYTTSVHVFTDRSQVVDLNRYRFKLEPLKNTVKNGSITDVPYNERIKRKAISSQIFISKWAIVVGISEYKYSNQKGLTNLIFADDDAKAFVNTLKGLNWNESHIKLLTNEEATQRNIMIALESWLSKAGPSDQIILFWAGHGYPDPEDPEKIYFACYDTDISIPATGYRMDKVRTALEERKTKNVILLADTCHAGKLITRGDGRRGISIIPNIKKQSTPKGWVFMVGADTDRQAIEHTSWKHGAFTHSLIKGLNGEADGFQSAGAKDGIVTMGELKDYMKTSMPDETQRVLGIAKHPVITTSTGDPDIWNLTIQVKQ